ncbi:MAG: DNA-binding transcriptional regulator [Verrucomicrobiota bacterium]
MTKTQKNVLIALGWYDHRLLQGIATYATEHQWHIASHSIIHEKVIPWGWKGDGVLAWLAAGDDLADFVVSLKKPTVDFSMRRPHLPFAHVALDHDQAGRLVAEHFLARGFENFFFYSDIDNWTQEQRGDGFLAALKEAGHACQWLRWYNAKENKRSGSNWAHRRKWLLKHLQGAPKPIAIFVANGALAVEVQELCDQAGLAVPDEVAIVGIEDYLLPIGGTNRSISGVDTNLEEQGYQGAALLDRMMHGARMPALPVRIAPARIIIRKSSDIFAVAHNGVSRALNFIAKNFGEVISVNDVAKVAGMSVRGLHQAFGEHINCTPGEKIREVRLGLAKKQLSESEEKIESIAQQCGYPNINTFFIAFQKAEGMTPGAYRKATRRGR